MGIQILTGSSTTAYANNGDTVFLPLAAEVGSIVCYVIMPPNCTLVNVSPQAPNQLNSSTSPTSYTKGQNNSSRTIVCVSNGTSWSSSLQENSPLYSSAPISLQSPNSSSTPLSITGVTGQTSNVFQASVGSTKVYVDGEGDFGTNVLELPIQSVVAGTALVQHDNAVINLTGTAATTSLPQASTALNHVYWIRNGSSGPLELQCFSGDTVYDGNVFYTSLFLYGGDVICLQAQQSGAWQVLSRNTLQPVGLIPMGAPPTPASGWVIYCDSGDGNKLKAIAHTGTIVTLGTP